MGTHYSPETTTNTGNNRQAIIDLRRLQDVIVETASVAGLLFRAQRLPGVFILGSGTLDGPIWTLSASGGEGGHLNSTDIVCVLIYIHISLSLLSLLNQHPSGV